MTEKGADFQAVYEGAIYAVLYDGCEVIFRISKRSIEVDRILEHYEAASYALITAYNPLSAEIPEVENLNRQRKLRAAVTDRGFRCLEGYGGSEDGSWPPEPSLFVLGMSEEEAVLIAQKFEQHAIVYGEKGSPPRLVWCE